ncbi:MAG: NAD(P)/FAD-dependent oxidoreductase, partial [Candidatus Nanoarchaeia archaeon]
MNCPDCRSTEITLYMGGQFGKYLCKSCGYVGPLILEKDAKPIQIVVVGAGFGGLRTALLLKKRMKKEVSVTVIDKQRRHVFIPALMDYLAKMLHKDDITIELESLLKRRKIQFLRVIVNSVNVHRKKVGMGSKCISYDYLVVAIGVETHAHNVLGVDKYAHAFRTIEDADRLRAAVKSLATSKKRMNIVIVGGGTTGVQLAAYLRTYADSTFPNRDIIITLIHSHKRLLNELPAKVGRQVEAYLQKMRANIILAARVSKVRKNKLYLTKNNAINADLIVWTAGVKISQQ